MTRARRSQFSFGRHPSRSRVFAFAFACAVASGCSVDKEEHPDWVGNEDKCESKPGAWMYDRGFCYRVDAGSGDEDDAGTIRDASAADGGDGSIADAGGDAGDAGPMESCMPGLEETCYDGRAGSGQQQPCHPGLRKCTKSGWGECKNQVIPKDVDSCNGIDDDCDGTTDEGQPQRTCLVEEEGVMGACAEGLALCDRGRETCIRFRLPTIETCNGVDDDCDGSEDEDTEVACYPADEVGCTANGTGGYDCAAGSICAPGKFLCDDGSLSTECAGAVTPEPEVGTPIGGTAVDENCDGMTDEGKPCVDGQVFQCYTGPAGTRNNAPCMGGTRTCSGGTMTGACIGQVLPQDETCANDANTDDDCDGVADDVPSRNTSCADQSSQIGACKANAVWQCVDGAETCVDGTPGMELCDGNGGDEDCDTRVDEGFNLSNDENNCGACGVRCSANQTCCGSACVNLQISNAHCGSCANACSSALTCCAGNCVNTRTSATNCGSCGNSCLLGGVLSSCANSSCKLL